MAAKPCNRCGGPKPVPARKGAKYCDPCVVAAKEEARVKAAERSRRNRATMTPAQRDRANLLRRERSLTAEQLERKRERHRRYRQLAREARGEVIRIRIPTARKAPKPIPVAVRDAWKRSSRGSILQRKYPTYEALRQAAARGEFDHLAA